jgi:RNA polymerase sigma-70 factor, ECF subfamily
MEHTATGTLIGMEREDPARALDDFDEVVRLHRMRITRYLMACLRDEDAAETLTQECLWRAYRGRASFRGDCQVSTWLLRIAVNLVRDHTRVQKIKFWKSAQVSSSDVADVWDSIPDQASSPEERVVAGDQLRHVWAAVEQLTDKQKTVFVLRFVEEMELGEIAATTGMNESTVKSHLYRALGVVRKRIGGKP